MLKMLLMLILMEKNVGEKLLVCQKMLKLKTKQN